MSEILKWLASILLAVPVVAWAWSSRKQAEAREARARGEAAALRSQLARERAARRAAEKERKAIHAAYHEDAERLAKVAARVDKAESLEDVATLWRDAFGGDE